MRNGTKAGVAGAVMAVLAGVGGVLTMEGGESNHRDDPGGHTNFGITERTARAHGYTGSMSDFTREQALDIYAESYVYKPNYHMLLSSSPALGHKVIDAGVNVGPGRASRWTQEAINALSRGCKDYACIAEDGSIGFATMSAYAALERTRGRVKACELVMKIIDGKQVNHYLSLKNHVFTVGWIDHRIGNVPLERCKEKLDE